MTIAEPETDRGAWMQTFTGRAFYPLDPVGTWAPLLQVESAGVAS